MMRCVPSDGFCCDSGRSLRGQCDRQLCVGRAGGEPGPLYNTSAGLIVCLLSRVLADGLFGLRWIRQLMALDWEQIGPRLWAASQSDPPTAADSVRTNSKRFLNSSCQFSPEPQSYHLSGFYIVSPEQSPQGLQSTEEQLHMLMEQDFQHVRNLTSIQNIKSLSPPSSRITNMWHHQETVACRGYFKSWLKKLNHH